MSWIPRPLAYRRMQTELSPELLPAGPRRYGLLSGWLIDARTRAAAACISGSSVLDAGCNIADLAAAIPPNIDYVGLELVPEIVELAARIYPDRAFLQCDLESDWPEAIRDRRFDHVVMLAVIEHLRDPAAALARARAQLAPGGTVLVSTPHPRARRLHALGARLRLFSRDADDEHERFFDQHGLDMLAQQAGLRMLSYRRFQLGLNQLAVLSPRLP